MAFSPYGLSMNHEPSTMNYEQWTIMQNKPNFLSAQTNLSSVKTINYEQIAMNYEQWTMNDYAKQTQFPPGSNERNFCYDNELWTKNYERSQQKQTQSNPICRTLEWT